MMEPSDYGFSDELVDRLRRWHAAWERLPDTDDAEQVAEPSGQPQAAYQALRRQAIAVIRLEVPADVEVQDG